MTKYRATLKYENDENEIITEFNTEKEAMTYFNNLTDTEIVVNEDDIEYLVIKEIVEDELWNYHFEIIASYSKY